MPAKILMGAIALALLASPALATEANYSCADGTELKAVFSPPDASPGSAVLTFAGSATEITLPQALSADGGRYTDADMEFWIKGNEATLTRAGKATTCKTK